MKLEKFNKNIKIVKEENRKETKNKKKIKQ
jgi:hypothetical protein